MIVTERSKFRKYASLNPYFSKVCDFLENTDLNTLKEGRNEIDGDNVFAMCFNYVADNEPGIKFEAHKDYLDIHLVVKNTEKIAVTSLPYATQVDPYSEKDDVLFYKSDLYQTITLTESNMVVAFADDFHQPKVRINDNPVKKVVIKVRNY
ncbi:YhcH/YjgK/YiaL family protein [Lactobacillus mulieris]|uniref:YhcH/YjgK/YiaL family protein n=1 Tax=Lactobacillus TaxID=1578 RepID=UPI00117A283B|nr:MULTISPECIES: YhcH/YjgK/YiaL family protein [Lactobacillus]KAA9244006.1 YhcH/YjgK/YiaL family protein [Lactobacillus jensenii]MCW8124272.1 YhcH/YjgK/YiaL family protein [Lactobacillus mulieris]MCZ9599368.1 YhcH/YjgK/YiaL family protein [Lactobacillus mulieris]MDK7327487.1 YhcH/YjgK/YiaL family protein [Lactobacillus mulieris]TRT38372.1 YhcH/YjgK/YiaL family protein [Lactobacillus sp. c10Ua232AE]